MEKVGDMLETLTRDDFANQVNTLFILTGISPGSLPTESPPDLSAPPDLPAPPTRVALKLCQVSELRVSRHQEAFSLVFQGPAGWLFPQQIYHLVHEQFGPLDIFLVPIQQDSEGIYYEAVFNRMVHRS